MGRLPLPNGPFAVAKWVVCCCQMGHLPLPNGSNEITDKAFWKNPSPQMLLYQYIRAVVKHFRIFCFALCSS